MKFWLYLFPGGLAGVLMVLAALALRHRSPPEEHNPTSLSSSWPTFTDAENGFEIRYPPGWQVRRSLNIVNFGSDTARFSIHRIDEATRKEIERLDHRRDYGHQEVKIGALTGERANPPPFLLPAAGLKPWRLFGIDSAHGGRDGDHLAIKRGSDTYSIGWTAEIPRGPSGEDLRRNCEEMLATFRFIEVKHSDYHTYEDAARGLAFDYPWRWTLGTGSWSPLIHLMDSRAKLMLWVDVKSGLTFDDFCRERGDQVTAVEGAKEHFLHHLAGHRFRWLRSEAYAFEKADRLYVITVLHGPPPGDVEAQKELDDFLDSVRF